ncbi:MAG: hypothetical protein ACRDJU_03295 [Actinomycetota bacterium]
MAWLNLGLLVALIGWMITAAVVAGNRSSGAYPAFAQATRGMDVSVGYTSGQAPPRRDIRTPRVAATARAAQYLATVSTGGRTVVTERHRPLRARQQRVRNQLQRVRLHRLVGRPELYGADYSVSLESGNQDLSSAVGASLAPDPEVIDYAAAFSTDAVQFNGRPVDMLLLQPLKDRCRSR